MVKEDDLWSPVPTGLDARRELPDFTLPLLLLFRQQLSCLCFKFYLSGLTLLWRFINLLLVWFYKLLYTPFLIWFSWHSPWEAEITNFDPTVVINQDIGWLQVSMDDVSRVYEVDSTKDVVQNGDYVIIIVFYFLWFAQHLTKVWFNELHHYKNVIKVLAVNMNEGVIWVFCFLALRRGRLLFLYVHVLVGEYVWRKYNINDFRWE